MAKTGALSRVTAKGQATVPASVRAKLGIKPGDTVAFEVKGDTVTLRKVEILDPGFLALASRAFDDWNTPEADEAFKDL